MVQFSGVGDYFHRFASRHVHAARPAATPISPTARRIVRNDTRCRWNRSSMPLKKKKTKPIKKKRYVVRLLCRTFLMLRSENTAPHFGQFEETTPPATATCRPHF